MYVEDVMNERVPKKSLTRFRHEEVFFRTSRVRQSKIEVYSIYVGLPC